MTNKIFHLTLSFFQTETSSQDESESRENTAVLSITYEKLSHQQQFSDSLEVVTAPLCLTFVPGLTDKLKKFFQTPSTGKYLFLKFQ